MTIETKTNWRTKEKDGKTYIICQNSDLAKSKYPEWGPEDETPCDEWSEIGESVTAVTCWRCAARSVGSNFIRRNQ